MLTAWPLLPRLVECLACLTYLARGANSASKLSEREKREGDASSRAWSLTVQKLSPISRRALPYFPISSARPFQRPTSAPRSRRATSFLSFPVIGCYAPLAPLSPAGPHSATPLPSPSQRRNKAPPTARASLQRTFGPARRSSKRRSSLNIPIARRLLASCHQRMKGEGRRRRSFVWIGGKKLDRSLPF